MIHVAQPLPTRSELEERYSEHIDSYERALYELHRRLKSLLKNKRLRASVKYRVKDFPSYWDKIQRRQPEISPDSSVTINDVLGIRIVCPFLDDLTAVEELLTRNFSIVEREKKGAEFSFKEFGYDSVHYLIELPGDVVESFHLNPGLIAEVQLRTILQDAWAEVEHEMVYKSHITPFDEKLRRKLAALNANLSLSDMIFHEIRVYQRELQTQLDRRRMAFMSMIHQPENPSPPDTQNGRSRDADPGIQARMGMDSQESQLLKALYAHNAHHYDEALESYNTILEGDSPPNIRAMVLLHRGMAHFARGEYEGAEKDFTDSLAIDDHKSRGWLYLGLCRQRQKDDPAALEHFNRSLEIDQANIDALLCRAQLFHSLGDLSMALQDCDAVLRIDPESSHGKKFRDFLNRSIGV